ncbi:hypothetical protein B0T11DRAFT_291977 [Plectosphaerella cucumerina]|uniref:Uncharacterized protein n=1 Tax=Plectosphaerella cucumerina TaxID=40658 RepID=A0A8K0WY75_9PEZI|nr:hypothetical protein B0T11DRAFT_291977 [Plectosphaerella cucumerina]
MATQQLGASRRPKLTLSIKSTSPRASKLASVDPKSPTVFNTLSNVYVTAIERSTPLTAIHHPQTQPPPRLQLDTAGSKDGRHRFQTPLTVNYPETPLSANPASPIHMELSFPTIVTSTPPLSAGPSEPDESVKFSFTGADGRVLELPSHSAHPEPRTPRRRAMSLSGSWSNPPYTHPRSLHSILRNSPLPPITATPISPRRQSARLQEKAARRVAYHSPLEQTITTNLYIKSHVDLLAEDSNPNSPASMGKEPDTGLDVALAYTAQETRDGGQTPGPFEEMRRRMAGLAASSPLSPSGSGGIRKRKKKEKKRRWVWTLGKDEAEEGGDAEVGGAVAAVRAAQAKASSEPPPVFVQPSRRATEEDLPTPSVEGFDENLDVPMLEPSALERQEAGFEMDIDMTTPIMPRKRGLSEDAARDRLGSEGLFNPETGSRRDTPVPPDMMML